MIVAKTMISSFLCSLQAVRYSSSMDVSWDGMLLSAACCCWQIYSHYMRF